MQIGVHDEAVARLVAKFEAPVMQNNLRSMYVEEQVGVLLGDGWRSVGADWAAFDFESVDGVRLEVKQSSAKQTWLQDKPSMASFDIRARVGRYEGAAWVPSPVPGRAADIYLFAWHGRFDDVGDQRDVRQWDYFVVAAMSLPASQKTIGLSRVRAIASHADADTLCAVVDEMATSTRQQRPPRPAPA